MMKCPRCQHENRSGAKFCEQCATPLARTCPNCGSQLSATAKFCSECAHPVAGAAPEARFTSPESYAPKHLAEKILTSNGPVPVESVGKGLDRLVGPHTIDERDGVFACLRHCRRGGDVGDGGVSPPHRLVTFHYSRRVAVSVWQV